MIRFLIFFTLLSSYNCTGTVKGKADKDTASPIGESDVTVSKSASLSWENTSAVILDEAGYFPKFLPNKDQFIYTDKNYNGLWISDIRTHESKEITEARGAGYQPFILGDQIIYQQKGKKTTYRLMDLSTRNKRDFSSKSEAILAAMKTLENHKSVDLAEDLNSLIIYEIGQKVKTLRPGDFSNYLNPSFSPDGQKILFEVSGIGGFVCGLDGDITHRLGSLDQPSWINDEEIVYARSEDDGMVTTKGEIYIRNLASNEEFRISKGISDIMENPTVHYKGNQIIASSEDGQLVLLKKSK